MAPYFGTSLFVWGNILGIVLAALSVGYYYGGRLADRSPRRETLGFLTWFAGLAVSAIPLASPLILHSVTEVLSGLPLFLIAASFVSMLILFAVPLGLLGALTPLAVRIGVHTVGEVGSVSGSLSAASTAGSLVGAFLPSFLILPLFGTRFTILSSAIVLILLGSYAARQKHFLLALLIPMALFAFGGTAARSAEHVIYEKESPYQYIRVTQNGDLTQLTTNEGAAAQSVSMGANGLSATYTDAFALMPTFFETGRPLDILLIGVAGGTAIRQLHYFSDPETELRIDAVEIDPAMFEIAKTYFGLQEDDARLIAEDGRTFLRRTEKAYDIIMVDAYQQELYIPFHLATVEFYELVRMRLKPQGILAFNTIGESKDDPLTTHLEETVRSALPETWVTQMPGYYNHLIMGSPSAIIWSRLKDTPSALQPLAVHVLNERRRITKTDHLLTDDRAPVEYLTDRFLWRILTRVP